MFLAPKASGVSGVSSLGTMCPALLLAASEKGGEGVVAIVVVSRLVAIELADFLTINVQPPGLCQQLGGTHSAWDRFALLS
ncbi:unnamed protein product [Sphagnum troendelagicum]|uniref:Uncharacterized protein n=1 Tax=Sphagnum troendelagicum TaxID=128251 RepID=A0ABP0UH66_9BRYO